MFKEWQWFLYFAREYDALLFGIKREFEKILVLDESAEVNVQKRALKETLIQEYVKNAQKINIELMDVDKSMANAKWLFSYDWKYAIESLFVNKKNKPFDGVKKPFLDEKHIKFIQTSCGIKGQIKYLEYACSHPKIGCECHNELGIVLFKHILKEESTNST